MKLLIDNIGKSLWVTVENLSKGDLFIKEKFYEQIMLRLLNKNSVCGITISPQIYSLGFEIKGGYSVNVNGTQLLVNEIESCTPELIHEIVVSEEFSRNLFIVVNNKENLLQVEISDVLLGIKERTSNSPLELIFCENDGDSLCIRNSEIKESDILVIANELKIRY
jgi:hypothetical protein